MPVISQEAQKRLDDAEAAVKALQAALRATERRAEQCDAQPGAAVPVPDEKDESGESAHANSASGPHTQRMQQGSGDRMPLGEERQAQEDAHDGPRPTSEDLERLRTLSDALAQEKVASAHLAAENRKVKQENTATKAVLRKLQQLEQHKGERVRQLEEQLKEANVRVQTPPEDFIPGMCTAKAKVGPTLCSGVVSTDSGAHSSGLPWVF